MKNAFVLAVVLASAAAFSPHGRSEGVRARTVLPRLRGGQANAVVAFKTPPQAYTQAATIGAMFGNQPFGKMFVNAVMAGCYIGFGGVLAITVGGALPGIKEGNPGLQKMLLGAFGLPFGLFMNVMTGGQLFTGNTALVTTAYLDDSKKTSLSKVLINWAVVYVGNFVGSLLVAWLTFTSGVLGAGGAAIAIATSKATLEFGTAFVRGVLCNWMVCMALWIQGAAHDVGGKAIAIWLIISSFVAMGFEHSVANMMMIPLGMMHGADLSISQLMSNLIPVSLGNILSGVLAVAVPFTYTYGGGFVKKSDP